MADVPLGNRLAALFDHLGVDRAHVDDWALPDFIDLIRARPEAIASMTLLGPEGLDPELLGDFDAPVLLIHGDRGQNVQVVPRAKSLLPEAKECVLAGYEDVASGNAADAHAEPTLGALVEHLTLAQQRGEATILRPADEEGWVDGIWYRLQGAGPALLLFPLGLSAAQWEPLIPRLSEQFATITLGGTELGAAANLARRARSPWYQGMLRNLLILADPKPGERILEVGCGSGVVCRWLAHNLHERHPIVGIERIATSCARRSWPCSKKGVSDSAAEVTLRWALRNHHAEAASRAR